MNLIEAGTDEYSGINFQDAAAFRGETQADDAAEQARQPAAVADVGDQARTARCAAFARLALAHFDLQNWMARVGNSRRRCTLSRCFSCSRCWRSGGIRALAAATAS